MGELDASRIETQYRYLMAVNPPFVDLTDGVAVHQSLTDFTNTLNNGFLNEMVAGYKKNNVEFPRGKFRVTTPIQTAKHFDAGSLWDNYEMTHVSATIDPSIKDIDFDGGDGLVLGFKPHDLDKTLWLAKLSFTRGLGFYGFLEDIGFYYQYTAPRFCAKIEDDERRKFILREPLPVIVQLQGIKDSRQASYFLSRIEWEQLMVEIMIQRMNYLGAPFIYMLPSSLNVWMHLHPDLPLGERFKKRYDATARNCGFTMQSNGLWGLNFEYIEPNPLF